MRKTMALLLCLLLLPSLAAAEEALFSWTVRLGGSGETEPLMMAPGREGGAFIVGRTNGSGDALGESLGDEDGFVLRVDGQGNTLWFRRFGGTGVDSLTRVISTGDGGCLALGVTTSSTDAFRSARGALDSFLVRLDENGETLWLKLLGGAADDELLDVVQTEEGDFLVCGRTKSRNEDLRANNGGWDAWISLLSGTDGKPLWLDRFGDGGDDKYSTILEVNDGWLVMGEYAQELVSIEGDEPAYEHKPVLMVYNADGSRQLDEFVVLGETGDNKIHTAVETDIGWLLLGETNSRSALMPSPFGGMDMWLLHIRQNGRVQWQRRFGSNRDEHPSQIRNLPDGGYLLLGTTDSFNGQVIGTHGGDDVWLLRVSSTGVLQWQQPLGGSDNETPAGLLVLPDGGSLVAGTTLSKDGDIGLHSTMRAGFLSHVQANGNLLWTRLIEEEAELTLLSMETGADGAYLLGSLRTFEDGAFTAALFVAKLSGDLFPSGE